jgi:AraC family transcriptional regulator
MLAPTPSPPGSMAALTFVASGVEPERVTPLSCGFLDWRAIELQWTTEPGSIRLEFDRQALLLCTEEVGGRCQVRLAAARPLCQAYFGDHHLSFVPPKLQVHIHARGMRSARFACFLFGEAQIAALTRDGQRLLRDAPPRLMFLDKRLSEAALLIVAHRTSAGEDRYGAAIARIFVALLERSLGQATNTATGPLNGEALGAITDHLLDHIGGRVSKVHLARFAGLPVDILDAEFTRMTGMSVKHWLVDARVRLAQRLMLDPAVTSLMEVAKLAGFADQSHLSRSFRTILGQTPSNWLRERR